MSLLSEHLSLIQDRWKNTSGLLHTNLLRRALLREVVLRLHAEHSRLDQTTHPLKEIKRAEKFIAQLRDLDLSSIKIQDLLQYRLVNPKPLHQRLPSEFVDALGARRLDRFDRKWEKRLLTDAVHCMWSLWCFDAWISVFQAERFHHQFAEQLWPHGIVLFVEGYPNKDGASEPQIKDYSLWKGRWYVCLSQDPEALSLQWRSEDGIHLDLEAPQWQKLKVNFKLSAKAKTTSLDE